MTFTEQIIEAARLSRPGEIVTIEFDPDSDWVRGYNVAWAKIRGEFEGSITISNDQASNVIVITNRFSEIADPGISIVETSDEETVDIDAIEIVDVDVEWESDEEEEN